MRLSHAFTLLPVRLRRGVAGFGVGLVFFLSVSGVSPELHAWFHAAEHTEAEHACSHDHATRDSAPLSNSGEGERHDCAVTMYSHGVLMVGDYLLSQLCEGVLRAIDLRAFERLALAQPRYLHRLPQAPPAV